jgi:spore maturation protein CgeB
MYRADVSFIGGWRPEREKVLSQFKGLDLKIWGPDWGRRCRGNSVIMDSWQGRPALGQEFSKVVTASKINLNIIDPTNFPAANMRFFEIPTAGGLQLSSQCPEMENDFCHGVHIFYYRDSKDLREHVSYLLANPDVCSKVAEAGRTRVLGAHTYTARISAILDSCRNQLT